MKKLIAIILAAACCGCANIYLHSEGKATPYGGTVEVSRTIAEAFVISPERHDGSQYEAEIAHAVAAFILPFLICDLPLEVVADTLTLIGDF